MKKKNFAVVFFLLEHKIYLYLFCFVFFYLLTRGEFNKKKQATTNHIVPTKNNSIYLKYSNVD